MADVARAAGVSTATVSRVLNGNATVAAELQNRVRDIAQQLGIDERSAEGHVERIRNKLGVRSRAQIATWWVASNAPN